MKILFQSLATGLVSTLVMSCGAPSDRKPTFVVSGRVTDKGKPIANATVVFHPSNGDGSLKPRGRTDEKGEYTLTTYDGNDGAPAGSYRVTVELWQTIRQDDGPVSRLPPKYAKPESSGFTAEVKSDGPNVVPAFDITK